MEPAKTEQQNPLVVSYLTLRKAIGVLGIALPFVLYIGGQLIFQTGLLHSISGYYHTGMGDVFVGTMVALGVFFFSYQGYPGDAKFGKLACIFAIGVALFPTEPVEGAQPIDKTISLLHLIFTGAYFATLIYFSYFLFTKSDQADPPPKKKQRNKVYRVSAVLMAICILGIIAASLLSRLTGWDKSQSSIVFWLETIAIISFGVSWITKGEAITFLNDPANQA